MSRFILKRLFGSVFVLLTIVTLALWVTRMAPSNPCLKERATNTCGCIAVHKLDRPVFPVYLSVPMDPVAECDAWEPISEITLGPVHILTAGWADTQYANYMGPLLFKGDLGQSMKTDRGVAETLASALPYTLQLGLQALLVALLIGVPAGLYAGLRQNTMGDYSTMTLAMIGVSIPNFVLGPLLIMFFALELGWFRPNGWDSWVNFYSKFL